nr:MAG TPA: head to tail adaptor [Caudoviricetes sp.]
MKALEIFRMVAKEFSNIPDEDEVDGSGAVVQYGIKSFIDLYADQISKKRFGSSYEKALAYLTAHKLKMNGYGDVGTGTIADSLRVGSYSEGETSISYTTGQQTNLQVDAEYALTVYGLEFLTLRRNAVVPIVSAGEAK